MSHVTPFLKKLHWLPIQRRMLFKYNLLVFRAINLSQALYLSVLIRSSSLAATGYLSPQPALRSTVATPAEWNKLPQTVRSQQTIDGFRSQLKTHLFTLAYPPTLVIPWRALFNYPPMPVPRLSLHRLKCIRGFVSILHSINPTITITLVTVVGALLRATLGSKTKASLASLELLK